MAEQIEERRVPFEEIRLDPGNPRLPEDLHGAGSTEILRYLYDSAVLDELARSYINNGFFRHEPLMVVEEDDHYVALEGNRRLAALKVLLQDSDAEEAELEFAIDEEPTSDVLKTLLTIPVHVVADRDEVRKYLGFRHIGGIKTWSAEAKARYLAAEVDRVAEHDAPFLEVAQRVGSNVQGVRNAYIAIATLHHARDEYSLNINSVLYRRFGVWTRCMNSPELRKYVGLGDPRSLDDVQQELKGLKEDSLREVLDDLTPQPGTKRPLLSDSRDVTVYAQALHNDQAHRALRDYGDFELARQIIQVASLPERLANLTHSVEGMISEISKAEEVPEGLDKAALNLSQLASALQAVVDSKT